MRKFFKRIGITLYTILAASLTILAGCTTLMPTKKPPLTDMFGYEVPEWKGWTLVGINQFVYKVESKKLETWAAMQELVNQPAIQLHGEIMNVWGMVATAAATGGIPLAWAHQPKTPKKKEEND